MRSKENMRYIHCTQKLLQEIKAPVVDLKNITQDNSGLGNWYCNLFRFNRRKCLIFTNELTLYSFFIYGVMKKDIESLPDLFRKNLVLNLKQSLIDDRIIETIIAEYKEIGFCKTASRSVLGSMNDFTGNFTFRLAHIWELTEREIFITSYMSNETPMGALKYRYPVEVLRDLIAERFR